MNLSLILSYVVLGYLTAAGNLMYVYGYAYLPVCTASLMGSTSLIFSSLFGYLLVKSKINASTIYAIVIIYNHARLEFKSIWEYYRWSIRDGFDLEHVGIGATLPNFCAISVNVYKISRTEIVPCGFRATSDGFFLQIFVYVDWSYCEQ